MGAADNSIHLGKNFFLYPAKSVKKQGGSLLGLLILFLFVKSILVILAIQLHFIDLAPDEAQYWTWSQHLDWGYYSKPSGIAWQIWLGTQLLGNSELGLRLVSVAIGFLLPLVTFFLAEACQLKRETAFWSGMIMGLSPLGIMASFLATTDGSMVLFWTLACLVVVRGPHYFLLGLVILCGALFKWPIYLFWIFVLLGMLRCPHMRSWKILIGIALSFAGLLPSVIWNSAHDWATFRHVLTTITGGHAREIGTTPLFHGNFFAFLGAQMSLLSPILFGLLIAAFGTMIKNIRSMPGPLTFCGMMSLFLLALFSFLALFQKMQGNWCVFAYPSGIILLSWYACEYMKQGKKWLVGGISLSVILSAAIVSLPKLQENGISSIPYKWNPFRHNIGWRQLEQEVEAMGYDANQHFLFGDKYQMTSILSFYSPGKKRAYFLNLQGTRKNQFSYWPNMADEQLHQSGFFIAVENSPYLEQKGEGAIAAYQKQLQTLFDEVHFLGMKPLFSVGKKVVKGAFLFQCTHYRGTEISNPELY